MSDQNKLSVIVPCYNVESYIAQCLESIVRQTYADMEIICINDGSCDNTLEILREFQRKDSRITIVDQTNRGLSHSRNVGVSRCSGNWVMFVDSDDWLHSDMIGKMFRKELKADLYCCSYQRIFKNNFKKRQLGMSGIYSADTIRLRMVGLTGKELSDPSQSDSIVTAWAKIYKTKIIKKNLLTFEDTKAVGTEDALFNIQYLRYAKKVFVLDEPLYYYRKSNISSLTSIHNKDLLIKWKNLYAKIENEIRDDEEAYTYALQNRICLGVLGLSLNEVFSKEPLHVKYRNMQAVLNDPIYRNSFRNFKSHVMPIHWRLFYTFAKNRRALLLLLLSMAINKIIHRHN